MIYLEQDSTNLICLSKPITSDIPVTSTTLNLIGLLDQTQINDIILSTINSGSSRYDLFNITITGATYQDKNNGVVFVNNNGQYVFNYYYNGQIVETGIANVYTTVDPVYEFTDNNNTQYFSYNNE